MQLNITAKQENGNLFNGFIIHFLNLSKFSGSKSSSESDSAES
jgi:hypothetical protein